MVSRYLQEDILLIQSGEVHYIQATVIEIDYFTNPIETLFYNIGFCYAILGCAIFQITAIALMLFLFHEYFNQTMTPFPP